MSSFVAINKRQFLEKSYFSPNKEAKVLNEYRPEFFSEKREIIHWELWELN